MIDICGKTIKIGDRVAYCERRSNTAVLKEGYVSSIDDESGTFTVWRGLTQKHTKPLNQNTMYRTSRVAKIG